MSSSSYDAGIIMEVSGVEEAVYLLGDLRSKAPAVLKTSVNATARETRKLMIAQAKARYAVNTAGRRHLDDLKQRKKATNRSISAELYIAKMRNDLGYFATSPRYPTHYTGKHWVEGPKVWKGKVLKGSQMKPLPGGHREVYGEVSKAFLAKFKSGHIGMVQRDIGSSSEHTVTANGYPRWRNKKGQVEKLVTLGSPSATAMHNTVWPDVRPDAEEYLQNRLFEQTERVLTRARAKQGLKL